MRDLFDLADKNMYIDKNRAKMEEAAAKKAAEETAKDPEIAAAGKKRMSIAQRAHLAENLDDAPEEEAK